MLKEVLNAEEKYQLEIQFYKKKWKRTDDRRTIILQPAEWKPQSQKLVKMRQLRNLSQMKKQDETPEEQLSAVEIANLPEKEFRIMTAKMIQDLGKRMEARIEEMQEIFNKDLEELKNKQREKNNKITEMKNTLEGINNRISEAEERISDLEDRMVEITAVEQNKENKNEKK